MVAERVPPEAAAQEDMGPAGEQEPVGQTRRSSPTRASTPSGAVPRAARGGKAAGASPPATQADLRALQVTLALLIAGHTTEIEQLKNYDGRPPGNRCRRIVRHGRYARADFLRQ